MRAIIRLIGRIVCLLRGHDFYYPLGCYDSWFVHSCIRCGAFDRPLETLERASGDDDCYDGFDCGQTDEEIAVDHERGRRWFSWAKYPKWV